MTDPSDPVLRARLRAALAAEGPGWAARSPLFARPAPDTPPAHDKALWLAGLLGALARLEGGRGTSARMGAEADAAADGAGGHAVRYRAGAPAGAGAPRTSLDVMLQAATPEERAALRAVVRSISPAPAGLDIGCVQAMVARAARAARAARPGAQPGPPCGNRGVVGVVGVVRAEPGSGVAELAADAAGDAARMAAVQECRLELVDERGRPRRLQERDLDRLARRVRARALAYFAIVIARHDELVRRARAGAKMCVEGSDAEYGGCGAPALPRAG